jgi:quercetin dioxygenase-like cupin family protein
MGSKLTQQAAPEHPAATSEVLHEDDKARITQWLIRPGEQIHWHRHEFEYVIVQQSTGRLHLEFADGSTKEFDYTPGGVLVGPAPVEHQATNVGDVDIVSLEIEYKM